MTFVRGLMAGRSHLAFLLGLGAAVLTVNAVGRMAQGPTAPSRAQLVPAAPDPGVLPVGARMVALDQREIGIARAAWSWFERNAERSTGLAPSAEGGHSTTMGDAGSQLMAILAAEDLGLMSAAAASQRLARTLASLAALRLCEGGLPNESYDVRTLEMVDERGHPAPDETRWSAVDVTRLLESLSAIAWRHPELAQLTRKATSRWRLESLTDGEAIRGATSVHRLPYVREEGRHVTSLKANALALEALAYRVRGPRASGPGPVAPAEARR